MTHPVYAVHGARVDRLLQVASVQTDQRMDFQLSTESPEASCGVFCTALELLSETLPMRHTV